MSNNTEYMKEKTNINNFKYTEWFKFHIFLIKFQKKNIVFRCTIPLTSPEYTIPYNGQYS